MDAEVYPHQLAAIYPDSESTEVAKYSLRYAGVGDVRFVHLHAGSPNVESAAEPGRKASRGRLITDMLVGGMIGAGAGALATDLPSLFVSGPALGPLLAAGYGVALGAACGAIGGAIKGCKVTQGLLAGMVQDAIRKGFHVLIVQSPDDATQARVERALADTLIENAQTPV